MSGANSNENSNGSNVKVVDVESEVKASEPQAEAHHNEAPQAAAEPGIEINFPGSEILRAKFPQSFKVAEKVATDWVKDGDFADLPLPGPAQAAAQQGLKKAKELEKKIANSPVTEKVTMQAFTTLMKAQNLFQQIKEKVQRK